jgi:hypothetical protein
MSTRIVFCFLNIRNMCPISKESKYKETSVKSFRKITIHQNKLKTKKPTNFIEISPSWEASSFTAIQALPGILWNLSIHYSIYKSLPMVWNKLKQNINAMKGKNQVTTVTENWQHSYTFAVGLELRCTYFILQTYKEL